MELAILLILGVLAIYCFLRSVFGMSHTASIITMITSAVGAYRSVSHDENSEKGDK